MFVRMRNSGRLSEEVLREVQYGLDLEEALLDQRVDNATGHLDELRADHVNDDRPPADPLGKDKPRSEPDGVQEPDGR